MLVLDEGAGTRNEMIQQPCPTTHSTHDNDNNSQSPQVFGHQLVAFGQIPRAGAKTPPWQQRAWGGVDVCVLCSKPHTHHMARFIVAVSIPAFIWSSKNEVCSDGLCTQLLPPNTHTHAQVYHRPPKRWIPSMMWKSQVPPPTND